MTEDRLSPEERAERMVDRAFGVKDRRMRTAMIGEILRDFPGEEIVEVLRVISDRAERKRPKYQEVYFSLMDPEFLTELLGPEKVEEVRARAREMESVQVLHLFASSDPGGGITGDCEVPDGLEYLTLGEKKSLARGERSLTWEKLLLDLDHSVIRNILRNPRITEREVLRISSRRPCPGAVLKEVYQNQRWIQRYRVKRALVFNPYTPVAISKSLIGSLLISDLQEAARDGGLDSSVRGWASDLLKKRKGKGEKEGKPIK